VIWKPKKVAPNKDQNGPFFTLPYEAVPMTSSVNLFALSSNFFLPTLIPFYFSFPLPSLFLKCLPSATKTFCEIFLSFLQAHLALCMPLFGKPL
jgi:hypothetical protein